MWCQSVISRVAKYEEPARLQRPSSFSVNGKTQSTGKECLCVCLRAFVRKDRREKVVAQLSDGREREREREKGWIRGHGRLIALQFKSWFLGKRYCTGRPREKQRASKENPEKKQNKNSSVYAYKRERYGSEQRMKIEKLELAKCNFLCV